MVAQKNDAGKPQFSTVPPAGIDALTRVMTYGARKYQTPTNYLQGGGLPYSRYFDAMHRHLAAWWAGEDVDPESGENHLGHVMASAAILLELQRAHGTDDRPQHNTPEVKNEG